MPYILNLGSDGFTYGKRTPVPTELEGWVSETQVVHFVA